MRENYGMDINKQMLNSFEEKSKIRICVIECNEIGLSTACLLADTGLKL